MLNMLVMFHIDILNVIYFSAIHASIFQLVRICVCGKANSWDLYGHWWTLFISWISGLYNGGTNTI